MTSTSRYVIALLALLALGWAAVTVSRRVYFEPVAKLNTDIETVSNRVRLYRDGLDDAGRIETELKAFVNRTLGGDLETVDHRLRTGLNRLAEQFELADVVVGTGRAISRSTPARRKFSRRDSALRDEIDFVELNGWITGQGTLEQALMLVDAIEAEPWIKRIDKLHLDPADNGAACSVTVRLTTLYLPGREPDERGIAPYDPARFEPYLALANVNPFRLPETPVDAAASAVAPDALASWMVTGIAETKNGAEVWIINQATMETRTLRAGATVEGITLVAARGDEATFSEGERQFVLQVGLLLSDRSRMKQ